MLIFGIFDFLAYYTVEMQFLYFFQNVYFMAFLKFLTFWNIVVIFGNFLVFRGSCTYRIFSAFFNAFEYFAHFWKFRNVFDIFGNFGYFWQFQFCIYPFLSDFTTISIFSKSLSSFSICTFSEIYFFLSRTFLNFLIFWTFSSSYSF